MKKYLLSAVACALTVTLFSNTLSHAQSTLDSAPQALGQGAVLSEIYGQGVHAFYAGKNAEAAELFAMAINNGSQDPRAYYFRGMVAYNSGNTYEAESDWQQGANLEVRGKGAGSIGQAIARFQGPGRLKLEEIRRKARLQYLAESAARSRTRYGDPSSATQSAPRATNVAPRPAPPAGIQPPPAPPVADENPFANDIGEPKVETEDALSDAMTDPFADDASAAADTSTDAPASDPFSASPESDPFSSDAGGGAASDPFSDGADAGSDPFGDDPFGN